MKNPEKNGDCCDPAVAKEATQEWPTFRPNVDIVRSESEAVIYADLPGVEPDGIEVSFERGVLEFRGRSAARAAENQPLHAEFRPSHFARSFRLSDELDGSQASAEYANGVLCLRVPVAAQARARKIEVRAGQG